MNSTIKLFARLRSTNVLPLCNQQMRKMSAPTATVLTDWCDRASDIIGQRYDSNQNLICQLISKEIEFPMSVVKQKLGYQHNTLADIEKYVGAHNELN